MNALWYTRMCAYKHSPEHIESARRIVAAKAIRQRALLRRYGRTLAASSLGGVETIQDVLLAEARAAKRFWSEFAKLIEPRADFRGRAPRGDDPVNRLLDIGYHHLTGKVLRLLEKLGIPSHLGLLHVAHTADSAPLAYDVVELFRFDTVDAEALRFIRMKKQRFERFSEADIPRFLHRVNERCKRAYYLKDFGQCHTYEYYMELQILKVEAAVNHRRPVEFIKLPNRHESRCLTSARAYRKVPSEEPLK